jgi:VanZ family protein
MSRGESTPDRVLRRAIAWLLAFTVLFIVYASLYPFEFDLARLRSPAADGWLAKLAWRKPARSDLIANLLFYLPFGVCTAYLAPRRWSPLRRGTFAMSTGAALSLVIELLQFTTRDRDPAMADFALNALSAGIGAALALSARGLGMRPVLPRLRTPRPDPIALLLVILWLAFHAAPFMPTASFIWHLRQPAALLDWDVSLAAVAGFFAGWALVGLALRNLLQPASFWPVLAALAGLSLLARVVIRAQQLELDECIGLALAMPLLASFRHPVLGTAFWIAPALVFFLLAPFGFAARDPVVDWFAALPLARRTIAGEPGSLELVFLYVGLVWLLCESRVSVARVVAVLFVAAGAIEMAQVLQPDKGANALAPAAVLAGGALEWLRARLSPNRAAQN